MAEKIKRPKLELADNGFILNYEIYDDEPREGDTYSGERYVCDKKKVFSMKEQDLAIKSFIKLGREAGLISGAETEEESEDE